MKIIGKKYLEPYNNKRQTNITLVKKRFEFGFGREMNGFGVYQREFEWEKDTIHKDRTESDINEWMSAISIDIEEREQNKKEKFLFIIIVLAKDGVLQQHISHCQTQFERICLYF